MVTYCGADPDRRASLEQDLFKPALLRGSGGSALPVNPGSHRARCHPWPPAPHDGAVPSMDLCPPPVPRALASFCTRIPRSPWPHSGKLQLPGGPLPQLPPGRAPPSTTACSILNFCCIWKPFSSLLAPQGQGPHLMASSAQSLGHSRAQ